MHWNFFNTVILLASLSIVLMSVVRLLQGKQKKTMKFFYWFMITSNLVMLQLMLIDIKITKSYPALLVFFLPFQYLAPVLFTAFTCWYLEKKPLFKKFRYALLTPFVVFFLIYSLFKVNVVLGYPWIPERTVAQFGAEVDENVAVVFSLLLAFWNYRIIKAHELSLGALPYQIVVKKTQWLRRTYMTLVVLNVFWLLIVLYLKIDDSVGGHGPYYPLWLAYLGFYYTFFFLGERHLRQHEKGRQKEKASLKEVATKYQMLGLNKVFTASELNVLKDSQYEVTAILSYFASSLFDKNKEEEVLWDIVKNCIAKLDLEDCVIYVLDADRGMLVQKAAYGNKEHGEKKILSPIEIPLGKGVVGTVAQTQQWELISDVTEDSRYIMDDQLRASELAVPIVFEGSTLGVLDSEHSEKDFFKERHLFLFQLIAKLTATKLQQLSKKSTSPVTNDNAYFKELCYLLESEKIYRDAELNLTVASEKLNISSNYLSQLVNKHSEYNFSDFVNSFRVKEAQSMLIDPEFSGYTMLAIGYEAGFNSKSAFYNSFKKHAGMSPSDYKEKHPIKSHIF